MKKLLKAGAIPQLSKMSDNLKRLILSFPSGAFSCTSCDLAKKTLRSLPRTSTHPPKPRRLQPPKKQWQLLLGDHCGPFSVQYGGNTYYSLLIEDCHDVGFIFERNSLTGEGSADCLVTVDNMARRSSDGVVNLRTDEGSDWKSSVVAEVCADRGIHHQYALVDAHGQIGKVERTFRFYNENADAMLRASGAPIKFKFMAIKFINFIQQCCAWADFTFI